MTTPFPASPSPFRQGAALQLAAEAGWNPAEMPRFNQQQQAALLQHVPDEVALAVSSPSTPVTVAGVRGGYAAALLAMLGASWSRVVASVFPSSSPSETYPWLRSAPNPRKWEGERTAQELRGDVVTIVNDDYETTIEFRVPELRRDKTQQIAQRIQDLATRVAFFPEQLLTSLLVTNGNAYDGKPFFAVDHVVGQSGTINNALTTSDGLAGGATPTTDQQSTNISRMLSAMLGFRDDQGQPLHGAARQFVVMVPAPMYAATVAAINASFTSAAASNPLPELSAVGFSFVPIVNPRLTATNQLYLLRVDGGIRSLLLQEEGVNPVELGPESEHAKRTNRVLFGHGWAGGAGYGRFEFAMRGTTS